MLIDIFVKHNTENMSTLEDDIGSAAALQETIELAPVAQKDSEATKVNKVEPLKVDLEKDSDKKR